MGMIKFIADDVGIEALFAGEISFFYKPLAAGFMQKPLLMPLQADEDIVS